MTQTHFDTSGNFINYYNLLNLPREASRDAIRASFCSRIKLLHPDITGTDSIEVREALCTLVQAYRTLMDDGTRLRYDSQLQQVAAPVEAHHVVIPRKRVKYSFSLKDLLQSRLLNRKIRRRDRIYNFGQDIEIFVTPDEASKGAVAYVELPSRVSCPLCYGGDRDCHLCHGVGRISSTTNLEVYIPPGLNDQTYLDVDLLSMRPDRFTSFTMKTVRIKFTIIPRAETVS